MLESRAAPRRTTYRKPAGILLLGVAAALSARYRRDGLLVRGFDRPGASSRRVEGHAQGCGHDHQETRKQAACRDRRCDLRGITQWREFFAEAGEAIRLHGGCHRIPAVAAYVGNQ